MASSLLRERKRGNDCKQVRYCPAIWGRYDRCMPFKKGQVPWNAWTIGLIKPNSGSFKKGEHRSPTTEFKKGGMPRWKGEDAGYTAKHVWVTKHLGRPHFCEECGSKNLGHRQYHWANISGKYLRVFEDWRRLCVKCHKRFDKKTPDFCKCGRKYYAKGMCESCYYKEYKSKWRK